MSTETVILCAADLVGQDKSFDLSRIQRCWIQTGSAETESELLLFLRHLQKEKGATLETGLPRSLFTNDYLFKTMTVGRNGPADAYAGSQAFDDVGGFFEHRDDDLVYVTQKGLKCITLYVRPEVEQASPIQEDKSVTNVESIKLDTDSPASIEAGDQVELDEQVTAEVTDEITETSDCSQVELENYYDDIERIVAHLEVGTVEWQPTETELQTLVTMVEHRELAIDGSEISEAVEPVIESQEQPTEFTIETTSEPAELRFDPLTEGDEAIHNALASMRSVMKQNIQYAHNWHRTLAHMCYDANAEYALVDKCVASLMRIVFEVDTTGCQTLSLNTQPAMPTPEDLRLKLRAAFEEARNGKQVPVGTFSFLRRELGMLAEARIYDEEFRRNDLIRHGYRPPELIYGYDS